MNEELERTRTEAIVVLLKVLPRHSPGRNEKNYENLSQDRRYKSRYSKRQPPEYKP
jgi:hypothetical protein